jgi:hypothetical protein
MHLYTALFIIKYCFMPELTDIEIRTQLPVDVH